MGKTKLLVITQLYVHKFEAVIILKESSCCYSTYVTEGTNVTACATIVYTCGNLPIATNISVLFTTSNGSAISSNDYGAISEERVFTVGSVAGQSICVSVRTYYDHLVEYTEYFDITLTTNSPNATIGDRSGGVTYPAYLEDINVAIVEYAGTYNFSQKESNSSVQLCVKLVGDELKRPVTAAMYPVSGTAEVGKDVLPGPVWISFSSGDTAGTISCSYITIVQDYHVENDEYFTVVLQGWDKTTAPYNNTAYITIIDDNIALIGLQNGNPKTTPEEVTTLSICVVVMNPVVLDIPIGVNLNVTGGTAIDGIDFTKAGSGDIILNPGSTSACTLINILHDTSLEYNEFLSFSLSCTNIHAVCSANGTIEIIEDQDTVTIGFAKMSFNGTEGGSNPFQICAQLVKGSLERLIPVYVTTQANGATAIAGKDYIPLIGAVIMFSHGSAEDNTTSCINFTVLNDNILDNTEILFALLSTNLTFVFISPTLNFATIYIFEDPNNYITVGFPSNSPNIVTEGMNLTLQLCPQIFNGTLGKDVYISVSTRDMTAIAQSDYGAVPTQLEYTAGQRTGDVACFTIVIVSHPNILEYPKQFQVVLTQIETDVNFLPHHGSMTVTILDNPSDGITVGFSSSREAFNESNALLLVCVLMYNGNLARNVSIIITSVDGTAEAYFDYIPINSTITFTDGMKTGSSVCINVTIIDDDVVEHDFETFTLSLTAIEPAVTTISVPTSIVSILEKKDDFVEIGLSQSTYIGIEGTNVAVCAEIYKGAIERTVSVYLSTISGTAYEGTNFLKVSSVELKMPMYSDVNETVCANVTIINNTNIQPQKEFTVFLETVDPAVNFTSKYATIVIPIDPHDVAIFEMKDSTVTVTEGTDVTFPLCVLLDSHSSNLTIPLSVKLVTQDVTAIAGIDYYLDTKTLTFLAWSIPGKAILCSTVSIMDDDMVGDTEEFHVFLTSNDTRVIINEKQSETIIYIMEDSDDSITVGFDDVNSVVSETAGSIEVCIDIVNGALERNVTVFIQTMPITATPNIDYVNIQNNITLPSGFSALRDDKICINITILNDHSLENNENFEVMLSATPQDEDVVLVSEAYDVITIIEDPYDGVEIGFVQKTYNVSLADGMVLVCAAIYKGTLERSVAVQMITTSDTGSIDAATPGRDFSDVRVIVEYVAGQSEFANSTQCISIGIFVDPTSEPVKTFIVFLNKVAYDSNVVNFTKGFENTTVEIYSNNTDYVFQFENTSYSQLEGFPVVICIDLVDYPADNLEHTVYIILSTKDGSARGGIDYDKSAHVLQFHPESQNGTIITMTECTSIYIIDDYSIEDEETFEVELVFFDSLSLAVTGKSSAVVTILQNKNDSAFVRFLDLILKGIGGESIQVCAKLEESIGSIERQMKLLVTDINGTAYRDEDFLLQGTDTISFYPGSRVGSIQCITVQLVNRTNNNNVKSFSFLLTSEDPSIKITQGFDLLTIKILYTSLQVPQVSMTAEVVVTNEKLRVAHVCAIIIRGTMYHDTVFQLLTLDNTATVGVDYISGNIITFMTGDMANTTRCANIVILDDYLLEPNETFYAVLTSSYDDIVTTTPTVTSVIIEDNPDNEIEIGFEMTNYTGLEQTSGYTANICIKILNTTLTLGRPLNIGLLVVSNLTTATNYSLPKRFQFSIGQGVNDFQCIDVTVYDNAVVEDYEELVLTLVAPAPVIVANGSDTVTVHIVEDSNDFIEIHWVKKTYAVNEGEEVELCAQIGSGALGKDVTVALNITYDSASSEDFYLPYGVLIFKSGQSAIGGYSVACIGVHATDDGSVERDESFSVELLQSDVVHISSMDTYTTVTILDDPSDVITIAWIESSYNATEGEESEISICANILNGSLEITVIVPFKYTQGSAIIGRDATISSWYLTFVSGQSQYNRSTSCVQVFITNDTILDDTKSFILEFTSTNRTKYLPFSTDVYITIYEDPNNVAEFSLVEKRYLVTEGLNNTIPICILLAVGSLGKPVTLTLQTVTPETDFKIEGPITFIPGSSAANSSTQCFVVDIIDDGAVEDTEEFMLKLTVTSSGCKLFGDPLVNGEVMLTIFDDPSHVITIGWSKSSYYATEGEESQILMCANILTGALERNVTVPFKYTQGTAVIGRDITIPSWYLSFVSGQSQFNRSTSCVPVLITNDTKLDDTKSFTLEFTPTNRTKYLPSGTDVSITIYENPNNVAEFSLVQNRYLVSEGLNNTLSICILLAVGSLGKYVTLTLEAVTPVSDFNVEGPITFIPGSSAANSSTQCFGVDIIDDGAVEDTEEFMLKLSVTSSGCKIFGDPLVNGELVLTIFDDPSHVITIGWSKSSYYVTEGEESQIQICANILIGALERNVTVPFKYAQGTAIIGKDITIPFWYLVFVSGQSQYNRMTSCVPVLITNDTILDDTKSFTLEFTSTNRTNYLPSSTDVKITIYENPNKVAEFSLVQNRYLVTEGLNNKILICILLAVGSLGKYVTLTLEAVTPVSDFNVEGPITFIPGSSAANSSTQCFVVDIIDDGAVEDTEEFMLKFSVTSSGCKIFGDPLVNGELVLTIFDDPRHVLTIGWSKSSYYATEGKESQIQICANILTGALETNVTVPFKYTQGTAITGRDITIPSWYLSFVSGQSQYNRSTSCVPVLITNDTILDDTKSFTLEFTSTNRTEYLPFSTDVNITIYEDPNNVAEFSVLQNQYFVTEGLNNTISICILLAVGSLGKSVTLTLETVTPVSDFQVEGPITFIPGSSAANRSTQCFVVDIIDDGVVEDTEAFVLNLVAMASGCTIFGDPTVNGEVMLTILNDNEVTIGFVQLQYDVDRNNLSVPLPVEVKMMSGELGKNVSLTVDLAPDSTLTIIPTFATNPLFSTIVTFTSGTTSGAVLYALLNISSVAAVTETNLVVTLKPIPKDTDFIHIINGQASIKIVVNYAVASTFPGIIGVSTGLAAGICVAVIAMIAMAIFSMYKRMKANKAITHGDMASKKQQLSPPVQKPATNQCSLVVEELI